MTKNGFVFLLKKLDSAITGSEPIFNGLCLLIEGVFTWICQPQGLHLIPAALYQREKDG